MDWALVINIHSYLLEHWLGLFTGNEDRGPVLLVTCLTSSRGVKFIPRRRRSLVSQPNHVTAPSGVVEVCVCVLRGTIVGGGPLHPKFEFLIPFSSLSVRSFVPSLPTGLIEGEIDSSVQ